MNRHSLALVASAALLTGCGGGGGGAAAVPQVSAPAHGDALTVPQTLSSPTPAASALSVAQIAVSGNDSTSTTVAASLANLPAAGSLLVAFVGTGDATAVVSPPAGWSAAKDAAGHACRTNGLSGAQGEQTFVHWTRAGDGRTAAFSFSIKTPYALTIAELHDADPTAPIEQCGGAEAPRNQVGGVVHAATLTARAAGDLPLEGYAPSTSGLIASPRSGWIATSYTQAQTKWMTHDVEYGPATAAAGDVVAPWTSFNTGTSPLVFAPSVAMLIAKAPQPTPAPSATPTPAPTLAPSTSLANGVPWPASFRPYAANSFWNLPVSNLTSPRLLANSDRIIGTMTSSGPSINTTEWGDGSGQDSHTVVFAHATDPLVYTRCSLYCNVPAGVIPSQIHLPAKARSSSGGDAHLVVVEVDGAPGVAPGTEVDMWYVQHAGSPSAPDWKTGDTITAGSMNVAGQFFSGPGTTNADYGADVGDASLGQGVVHYNELVTAGRIDHALFAVMRCGAADGSYVYPAHQPIDSPCTGGIGAPNGAHIWLDLSEAQIDALPSLRAWERVVLKALHNYGEYVLDTGCQASNCPAAAPSFVYVMFEDGGQYVPFGVKPPLETWAASQGWNPISIAPQGSGYAWATRYVFSDAWNPLAAVGGWKPHLHIVDPCYARGSC